MSSARMTTPYKELDPVEVPLSLPRAGIEAGDIGVVDSIYVSESDGEQRMLVEVSRSDGSAMALLEMEVERDGTLSVVSYSTFGG